MSLDPDYSCLKFPHYAQFQLSSLLLAFSEHRKSVHQCKRSKKLRTFNRIGRRRKVYLKTCRSVLKDPSCCLFYSHISGSCFGHRPTIAPSEIMCLRNNDVRAIILCSISITSAFCMLNSITIVQKMPMLQSICGTEG